MNLADSSNRVDQRAQPSGIPAHDLARGGSVSAASGSDQALMALHGQLCELVPDQATRASLLGLPSSVDAAWAEGRMLPVLRAHAKALRQTVDSASRASRPSSLE